MSASLAVQTAIRTRLVATSAVTALVPADSIVDSHAERPDPCIVLGEDQEVDEGRIARDVVTVYSTLHLWKEEPSLEGVKAIAGAIRTAINAGRLAVTGWHFGGAHVSSTRYLRDPDGVTSHGVLTIETIVSEVP
ncbi:DUF3168 domain-containing protein [Mesorhizobium sp. J428]|uniref:DUF3168 domain-containing protein n=1 Tax=Mesorhizobium sp. J428 TaxID=2898440 RepID=UPI002151108C|nr:DUF3168 domain-containing protein [Mesorhizobium sp. J428]MCR5856575.1 DUF3168 domain-containing protein [Mesorhizobium sp. J428]